MGLALALCSNKGNIRTQQGPIDRQVEGNMNDSNGEALVLGMGGEN